MYSIRTIFVATGLVALATSVFAQNDCYMSKTHCQCMQVTSDAKCYDFVKTTAQGSICTERTCGKSYKCDCGSQANEFCEIVSGTRKVYQKEEVLPSGEVKCILVDSSTEGASLLEGAAIPKMKPLVGGDAAVGIWTDTQCACSPKSANPPPPGQCAELLKLVGGQSYCTTRTCKAPGPDEMTCDIDGKSVCTRNKYLQEVYLIDGPSVGSIGGAPCHKESIKKESLTCTANCPTP